ncbi:MAG: hypothetical protein ACI9XO_004266 [Paraglaciecola sp.]|jgi:hypothetical protein
MQRIRPIELFLIQVLLYGLFWVWNDYIATLISTTFAIIAFCVLIVSLIAELLERSKVPRWYFWGMAVSVIAPILTALLFVGLMGGELAWMKF